MTRVIPPRESMPSEAAILRRAKPTLLRWSAMRSAVMRAASVLMLVRAALYWLMIFGAETVDFLTRPQKEQILIGSLAIILPMAGVGLWSLALWGVALWIVCLGLEIAPLAMQLPLKELTDHLWKDPFLAASIGLFLLFIVTAILSLSDSTRRSD